MNCPKCTTYIPIQHLNISTDMGQCAECGFTFKISEQVKKTLPLELKNFDTTKPPQGIWVKQEEDRLQIGSHLRSKSIFLLVPLFLGLFTLTSSIYVMQLIMGTFYLKLSLFGLPFLIFAILIGIKAAKVIFGKIELSIDQDKLHYFSGISKMGVTKSIYWNDIEKIEQTNVTTSFKRKNGRRKTKIHTVINIDGVGGFHFGSNLTPDKRAYVLKVLQKIHHDKK